MSTGFTCTTCGAIHDSYPLCYGPSAPEIWYTIPEQERESRCELSSDQCIVDGKYFFVLGRLEIPIPETGEEFVWLAWVSLSEKNFKRACELWETEGRETEPPCFAWFSSALPYEKTTLHLEAILHTRPLGERPAIELQECDHPLYSLQRHGMSLAELQALTEKLMHS